MRLLFFSFIALFFVGFANAQTKSKIFSKKLEQTENKELMSGNDTSSKMHLSTKAYFDEKNVSKGYVSQVVDFLYNEKIVIVKIQDLQYKYKVVEVRGNEWGTKLFKCLNSENKVCFWKFGKTNLGEPFAQFEDVDKKIIYSDSFK